MILIADSGSTKCTWLLTGGTDTETVRTRGINAIHFSREQIREVVVQVPVHRKAAERGTTGEAAGIGIPEEEDIASIYFYGAGCGPQFPEASEKLRIELETHFGTSDIHIESDLLGAARALFGRGEGIACILGTGSNSCLCRNGEIAQSVPPLGYILGDEGSGSALGRNLLNGIFKGHIPLREEFLNSSGLTYEEIIRRVYREPYANRFLASLAPFVHAHLACPEVREMVLGTFRDFAARNLHAYPSGIPVSFVGGVATHFEDLLREAMHTCGRKVATIVESPAEGLVRYHHGK